MSRNRVCISMLCLTGLVLVGMACSTSEPHAALTAPTGVSTTGATLTGGESPSPLGCPPTTCDTPETGTEYRISGFAGTTLVGSVLTITNAKGTFSAEITADTTFREAPLNHFQPTDPCRDLTATYNAAAATGDSTGIFSALSSLAAGGCHARIAVGHSAAPTDPCKSFKPLPTF